MAAVIRDLVRIPSVNPSLAVEEASGEADIAAFIQEWLAARGIDARLEEAAPGRPNVVAEAGRGEGPTLLLCAHVDTVSTSGMTIPPFDPKIEGNRLYGRGSYDMKGGAAAILSAAHAVAQSRLGGRLLLAFVVDEEYASLGATDFVRRHSADGAILTESSEGKLIVAHKGFVWISVRTEGRAAHGSRWDLGRSAIASMGRIIAALDEHDRNELRRRVHRLVGPASMHPARVAGGVGLTTYAPSCHLELERRTVPGETPEEVLEEVRRVIERCGEEATVSIQLSRSPLLCDPGARVCGAARRAVEEITGAPPEETGVAYWMDAAIFAEAGIPTVNYGPTGAGAHEAVEWVDVDSVATCARILHASARHFCGGDRR